MLKRTIEKIIVPVDGSHSCLRAREVAAVIAKKFGSTVTAVHVISHDFMHPELKAHYQLPPLILSELDKSHQKAGRKIIQNAEDFFKEENIPVQTELFRAEDPAEGILQTVEKSNADLLIMGNISETQNNRFALGSVAEKIVLYAKCPVLITKRKTAVRKLLVATDGSEQATKAVDYAVLLCQHFNEAKITLLHVDRLQEVDEFFKLEPKYAQECGEYILSATAERIVGVPYDTRLEFGKPVKTILKVAKEDDFDIIILGSRGESSVKRYLLGSVSADVSMHSQRSVLIVR